jgi:hypothetical protein
MGPEADIPFPGQLVSLPSADGAGPLDACHWWRRPRAVKDGLVGVLYVLKIVDCTKGNNRRINLGLILRYRNSAPMIAPRSANTAPVAKSKKSDRGYKKLIKPAQEQARWTVMQGGTISGSDNVPKIPMQGGKSCAI